MEQREARLFTDREAHALSRESETFTDRKPASALRVFGQQMPDLRRLLKNARLTADRELMHYRETPEERNHVSLPIVKLMHYRVSLRLSQIGKPASTLKEYELCCLESWKVVQIVNFD
ncbi:hypothetical protein EVAR_34734_1 [Eumeta japonica]|uniref:Uncharacterized protein n=1 Tax=Eumeta variegata TaxID=151549 RepID=A0A4C1XH20_EUMVA|nr:hypothetical protein EVAR_34734_1 [Eumeta japonica]